MRKTLSVLAIVASISVLSACGGSHDNSANSIPSSLIGEWYQVNTDDSGMYAKASVTPGSIQINLDSRDQSRIYWLGTFDGNKDTSSDFTIKSRGDADAMNMSLFGSGDKTKSFAYKNGEISYKFTMLGTTTTVRLAKQEYDDPDHKKTKKPSAKGPNVKAPSAPKVPVSRPRSK